jgi:hypothetical protein
MAIRDKSTGILIEEGLVILHINGDETDNSSDNLLVVTQALYESAVQSIADSLMALEDSGVVNRNANGDWIITDEAFRRWHDYEGKAKYDAWVKQA